MVSQIQPPTQPEVIYPDSDGQPVANNTIIQFGWIVEIKQNLDWLFADNPNIFVAGDLFWYQVEGRNKMFMIDYAFAFSSTFKLRITIKIRSSTSQRSRGSEHYQF
ncbi:hypothetical protein [Nostoc sp. JL34]|uniref:hypothetical protein n=1 Tax=Nostoc sp. JL34 TaxID=2815397 RepID=UPI0025F8485C|nr:hypothetical protein [Nostoc sp. JL34]